MHHYPCTGEIYLNRDINMDFLPTKVGSVVGSVLSSTQILLVTKAHMKKRDVGHLDVSICLILSMDNCKATAGQLIINSMPRNVWHQTIQKAFWLVSSLLWGGVGNLLRILHTAFVVKAMVKSNLLHGKSIWWNMSECMYKWLWNIWQSYFQIFIWKAF